MSSDYSDFTGYQEINAEFNETIATCGGLYRLYQKEGDSIFVNEIEDFLRFFSKYFKKEEKIKEGEKKSNYPEEKTIIYNYFTNHYFPYTWGHFFLPPQPTNVINITNVGGTRKEDDTVVHGEKHEEKPEKKKEFDLLGKILLSFTFFSVGGFLVYNLTYDYVESKLYAEAKDKQRICKGKSREIKEKYNLAFANKSLNEIDTIVQAFDELYKSKMNHRKINVASKFGMGFMALMEILGGLSSGPKFYAGNNIFYFTVCFGVPFGLYIFNKVQYWLSGSIRDQERINTIGELCTKLLDSRIEPIPPTNPEIDELNKKNE